MSRRRNRAILLLASVVCGGAVLSACSSGTSSGSPPTSTSGTGSGRSATKAPITGLVDMGVQTSYLHGQPFPTVDTAAVTPYAGAFGGIVVNETWAQLEPASGHEDWQDLKTSLAAVTTWNAQRPKTPLGVKLRIFGGYTAPSWAKTLGRPPITVTQAKLGTRTYGRWWTSAYESAWSSFQHALAAEFDGNALVREVSVSSCATSTGEPFVISPVAIPIAEAAGWTPAAQQACATSRAHGGPTCILGNNDVSPIAPIAPTAPTGRSVAPVYAEIDTLWHQTPGHVGVYFQTAGPAASCPTIAVALQYHASSVELWPPNHYQGFSAEPVATLSAWNAALRTGSSLSCSS